MVSTSQPPKETLDVDQKWKGEDPTRRAKWWYATFHSVTAMIGAGVLSLPYAMAYLGWGPGTMVLFVSWCMTLNTMWQMIQLHECVAGTRFDRYIDLGRYAFGEKLGPWIVLPQQLIVQVGCDIVYMVTGGKCMKKFMEMACVNCFEVKQSYWILIFGSIHFFLSQLPNFNSVAGVSLAAAIMSLSYSTIAWVGSLSRGRIENVSYAYKETSVEDSLFRVFNALGQISFAFAGHAVVLEIQATIPSTPEKPSRVPMWKGAVGAYFINAICYFPVALIGYWAFGQDVEDNVLLNLKKPAWLIASANLMVVVHVIGSYQELQSSKVFLKLKTWKKACIFKGASIFEGVLEIGVLEESLYLQRSFNSSRVFLKLEFWKKVWIFKGASIFEEVSIFKGVLEVGVLKESLYLQRTLIFEVGWKKACIFKGASIFEGVLEVGVLEESFYLQRSFNLRRTFDLRGWLTSGVEEASIS
ncbi:lysine histidine transporter-like 6 [Cucumis melo var. makuwa]|uniref:Lysine histidine transporter-like 6 n=1 Tax=Cucumis melo var. makuwa TaxID=1194695 RepID=A0A5A7SVL3_CUCMM|nr:lysine histidine transporter-like 6 [Cucumis melo var. makuwa]